VDARHRRHRSRASRVNPWRRARRGRASKFSGKGLGEKYNPLEVPPRSNEAEIAVCVLTRVRPRRMQTPFAQSVAHRVDVEAKFARARRERFSCSLLSRRVLAAMRVRRSLDAPTTTRRRPRPITSPVVRTRRAHDGTARAQCLLDGSLAQMLLDQTGKPIEVSSATSRTPASMIKARTPCARPGWRAIRQSNRHHRDRGRQTRTSHSGLVRRRLDGPLSPGATSHVRAFPHTYRSKIGRRCEPRRPVALCFVIVRRELAQLVPQFEGGSNGVRHYHCHNSSSCGRSARPRPWD